MLNTEQFPLTVMDRPIESETTKIVENSYRATILAFMNEWSLFAERNGVDLIKVIKAIKMRPTHSNMIFPGPGVGGYCLPKDAGLGYWAYKHILGFEDGDEVFKISPTAIDINDTRALHVAELTRDALRNMGRYIAGADVLICGASYRQDVGDTRYSGSEMVVRKLTEMGAEMRVHDPYVDHWFELEQQDVYPVAGPFVVAILPQPGRAEGPSRAEGPGRRVEPCRGPDPGRAARAVSRSRSRSDRQVGRRAAGRDRLLRHPLRREDSPLLRARLRSESPRPRPYPADQGAGAGKGEVSGVEADSRGGLSQCRRPRRSIYLPRRDCADDLARAAGFFFLGQMRRMSSRTRKKASITCGSHCLPAPARRIRSTSIVGHPLAIGAIAAHRVEGVGHGHDPRRQRNLFGLEIVRIAAAVPRLVMVQHDRQHFLQSRQIVQNVMADRPRAA